MAATERINSLIGGIVELKARYWSRKLRKSKKASAALRQAGESIPDQGLRDQFFQLVSAAVTEKAPALSMTEMKMFLTADLEAFMLGRQCGQGLISRR